MGYPNVQESHNLLVEGVRLFSPQGSVEYLQVFSTAQEIEGLTVFACVRTLLGTVGVGKPSSKY